MAAQVLTGTGNVSYTNNTGQNVRIIINTFQFPSASTVSMSAGGSTFSATNVFGFGKNFAYSSPRTSSNNMYSTSDGGLPIELMLSVGQSFSLSSTTTATGAANSGNYNIVIIPEAG
jgi:hypothetical protein